MRGGEPDEIGRRFALRFALRAQRDVDSAHAYLMEQAGEEVADEWKAGLFEAVSLLSTLPRRFAVVPEQAHFSHAVRQIIYRRRSGSVAYRVLYTIREEPEEAPTVFIMHVRHASAHPITLAEAHALDSDT